MRAGQPHAWVRPAVFGCFDGLTVCLGVLLSLLGQPALIVPTTVGVSLAEAVGMAAGEWLSASDAGLGAAVVIGGATGAAGILPALPYLWWSGWVAGAVSVGLFAALGAGIAVVRAGARGWVRALGETFGVLLLVAVVVALVGLVAHAQQPAPAPRPVLKLPAGCPLDATPARNRADPALKPQAARDPSACVLTASGRLGRP